MDIYIKDVIKAKGLQLQQVAEKIGYKSLPSFYRQINTPESVSMKTLIKIADAIGCSVNDFFTKPELTNKVTLSFALIVGKRLSLRRENKRTKWFI